MFVQSCILPVITLSRTVRHQRSALIDTTITEDMNAISTPNLTFIDSRGIEYEILPNGSYKRLTVKELSKKQRRKLRKQK